MQNKITDDQIGQCQTPVGTGSCQAGQDPVPSTSEYERGKRLIAMGQMAASLAHEIRNPLGSMELFCTLLKKDLADNLELFKLADQIHDGIKTLDRVISNCLQFARDITPKRKLIEEPSVFVNLVVTKIQPQADERGIKVVLNSVGEGCAEADPYLLEQALVNLLINAVEAVESRHVAEITNNASGEKSCVCLGSITVTSDLSDCAVWKLVISDTGMGISESDVASIFDPFFTTKKSGTGLGLAIVHSIVAAHQGNIQIKSELGRGTVVTVEIPLRAAAEDCKLRTGNSEGSGV